MNKLETDQGHEWLSSDGRILEKLVATPVSGGMQLSLQMPYGEPCVAIVEKMNIGAANNFCSLVRETYIERKASKKAASAERHAEILGHAP